MGIMLMPIATGRCCSDMRFLKYHVSFTCIPSDACFLAYVHVHIIGDPCFPLTVKMYIASGPKINYVSIIINKNHQF